MPIVVEGREGKGTQGCMKWVFLMLILPVFAVTGQSFEVAAIRPHDGAKDVAMAPSSGGRFYAAITLKYMIQVAYDVAPYQISGGPDWLDKEVWDVTARAQGFKGEIPLEQLRPMLRELIGDRFRLQLRAAKQDLPYFALLVDKKRIQAQTRQRRHNGVSPAAGTRADMDEGLDAILRLLAATVDPV